LPICSIACNILQSRPTDQLEVSVKRRGGASAARGLQAVSTEPLLEALDELRLTDALDLDDLAARAVPGRNADVALRQPQGLREERLERRVRTPVLRRRGDLDLEPVAEPPDDLVARRTRHDLHGQLRKHLGLKTNAAPAKRVAAPTPDTPRAAP